MESYTAEKDIRDYVCCFLNTTYKSVKSISTTKTMTNTELSGPATPPVHQSGPVKLRCNGAEPRQSCRPVKGRPVVTIVKFQTA